MKKITIQKTEHLHAEEILALQQLSDLCRQTDSAVVSYPVDIDEEAVHYMLYEKLTQTNDHNSDKKDHLIASLAMVPFDDQTAQCIALTAPSHRRQGYFTELLSQAEDDFEDYDILFSVPDGADAALSVLDAIGAEYDHCEHSMELVLSQPGIPTELIPEGMLTSKPSDDFSNIISGGSSCVSLNDLPSSSFKDSSLGTFSGTDIISSEDTLFWQYILDSKAIQPIGSFCTTKVSYDCLCLHHVEILPEYRGHGHGTKMLQNLIWQLTGSQIRRILLQVSGDNKAALALYEKTGFRMVETLSYYLY